METVPGLTFTAIDFEAANSDRASACAVGVAVEQDCAIVKTRSWLIRPHTGLDSFDRHATRVHGIDAAKVINARSLTDSMYEPKRMRNRPAFHYSPICTAGLP